MRPFTFCPACGARLDPPDDEGGARCGSCDRSWYRHSAPTVGAAIVRDGAALVTTRARDPEKGKIDVPGGFLKPGEDPMDGLRREVKEELGVEIDAAVTDCLSMVAHRYGEGGDYVLAIGFRARLVSGDPRPSDDVAQIRWVPRDELDGLEFAWEHDRELVRKALDDEHR